jgi:HD-like signal output (HDOD) protein
MESGQAFAIIDIIQKDLTGRIHDRFLKPEIFQTLDNPDATREAIEALRGKIGDEISLSLFGIANAVYLGTLRRGDARTFFEVVNRLGLYQVKALILALAVLHHGRGDPELELVFARSYATSVMAQVLALQMGFREEAVRKAELGGMLLEMGRKGLLVYRKTAGDEEGLLDAAFVDAYHPYLGERLAAHFGLPGYVRSMILSRTLVLEEKDLSLAGVVRLAHDTVRSSFDRYGGRLVLSCTTPKPATDTSRTLEAIIRDKFRAVGLENRLHIIRLPDNPDE